MLRWPSNQATLLSRHRRSPLDDLLMRTGLDALLIPGTEGTLRLAAPRVGRVTLTVAPGHLLTGGQRFGQIRILNRAVDLHVPAGTDGRVQEVLHPQGSSPVAWGEALATIASGTLEALEVAAPDGHDGTPLEEGEVVWNSPIEGQFYRRPAPDAPPYVEEGALLQSGAIVGLVEVMKFFHPVHFERVGTWRLVRFLVAEGAAVDSGAPLAILARA